MHRIGPDAIVKHRPGDFQVREVLLVELTDKRDARREYLLLRKLGYTTMEIIPKIAEVLGIASADIGYGGLKDEDGVTEQLVCVPLGVFDADLFRHDAQEKDRWYSVHH